VTGDTARACDEASLRDRLCQALQLIAEGRLGGYTTETYGAKADQLKAWLEEAGYRIVKAADIAIAPL
jgi:hypothetical protein